MQCITFGLINRRTDPTCNVHKFGFGVLEPFFVIFFIIFPSRLFPFPYLVTCAVHPAAVTPHSLKMRRERRDGFRTEALGLGSRAAQSLALPLSKRTTSGEAGDSIASSAFSIKGISPTPQDSAEVRQGVCSRAYFIAENRVRTK